jgi:hypothetical protein
MPTSSIRSVVALATSLLLFGCFGRSDEELDQPADLLPGQMALQEYPVTSSGIISSDLQGSLNLPLLGAEAQDRQPGVVSSASTGVRSVPIPSMVSSSSSPGLRNTGG